MRESDTQHVRVSRIDVLGIYEPISDPFNPPRILSLRVCCFSVFGLIQLFFREFLLVARSFEIVQVSLLNVFFLLFLMFWWVRWAVQGVVSRTVDSPAFRKITGLKKPGPEEKL